MNIERLTNQLKQDEGFRAKAYWDEKQWTFGHGCRAPGEGAVITEARAAELLAEHINSAIENFNQIFFGHINKFNDVRAEAFVNMIFNMGPGSKQHPERGGLQSFVNTLGLIFHNNVVPWGEVAVNLRQSKWYRQIKDSGDPPGRGNRIVNEIKTGAKA